MATSEFASMTVIELRKAAKDYGVKLGAGVSKADIVAKLEEAVSPLLPGDLPKEKEPAARIVGRVDDLPETEPAPAARIVSRQEEAPKPAAGSSSMFRSAWKNPSIGRGMNQGYQAGMQRPVRPGYMSGDQMRTTPAPRPMTTSRFGPQPSAPAPAREIRSEDEEIVRPTYLQRNPEPQGTAFKSAAQEMPDAVTPGENGLPAILQPVEDMVDFDGILEYTPAVSPDKKDFGWIRARYLVQSSKDVHITGEMVRRHGLRMGDHVTGKARKTGKENPTFLYPVTVNGQDAEKLGVRTRFEELTAIYPVRHIPMDNAPMLRMADLAAPIGYGSRCLVMVPPEVDKLVLFRAYAEAIAKADPEAEVMILLIDENPEDVTLFRDHVSCPVYATTFDQEVEKADQLVNAVLERAKRVAEGKKDAIILVDSLTRMAKTSAPGSPQAGKTATGSANPAGFNKTKRLLGAAHALREGGSVTMIGILNIDNGSRMDEAITEEIRDTANAELYLDGSVMKNGMEPAVNFSRSGTRRMELFLGEKEVRATQMLRAALAGVQPANAVAQLQPMISTTANNAELLEKLPEWLSMMKDGKVL